jgi:hypothetical protein
MQDALVLITKTFGPGALGTFGLKTEDVTDVTSLLLVELFINRYLRL